MPDKTKGKGSRPVSLSRRRRQGKMQRLIQAGMAQLGDLKPAYEDYVRWHRLLFDADPDPEEVLPDFPVNLTVEDDAS